MGIGRFLGVLGAGVVGIVAAPVLIPGAIVSTACTVGGAALAAGASSAVATAATIGTAYAATGAVGVGTAALAKKALDKEYDDAKDKALSRGVDIGRKGEQAKCDALKKENELKDEQIKKYKEQRERDKKLIQEQDKLLFICFEKYPDVIETIINDFNLQTQKEKAIDFYSTNTNTSLEESRKVINKLIEYIA